MTTMRPPMRRIYIYIYIHIYVYIYVKRTFVSFVMLSNAYFVIRGLGGDSYIDIYIYIHICIEI